MATFKIVPSIDRSSSSARVAASASTASHPAFDVHPFATRQQRDGRMAKSHRCDLRWEHLFKAVLKDRPVAARCAPCPRDNAASKFENRINYVHDVAVVRHNNESAAPVPA